MADQPISLTEKKLEADEHVIEYLELLLEQARRGEILGVTGAIQRRGHIDNITTFQVGKERSNFALMGKLQSLIINLHYATYK